MAYIGLNKIKEGDLMNGLHMHIAHYVFYPNTCRLSIHVVSVFVL